MRLSTAFTAVKRNFGKYLAKGVGVAALGVVAYDSHTWGKMQSDVYAKSKDANACINTFNNSQFLSSPSITTAKLKKEVFNFETESNTRHFCNSAIGYFKGFGSMLINSVVPLGLGLTALFAKGKWSKGAAIGLGAYAVIKFFKDILGLGNYNDLSRKF